MAPLSLAGAFVCSFKSDVGSYNLYNCRCSGGTPPLGYTVSSLSAYVCSGVHEQASCIRRITETCDVCGCPCRNTYSFLGRDRACVDIDPGQSWLLLCGSAGVS